MSGIGRSGEGYFVSYRDPEVKKSDDIYLGIPDYLENFEADERTMTKYVIGTISDIDTPLTPSLKGSRGLSAWYSGVTDEMLKKEREEILNATVEDIRALAPITKAVLETGAVCVVGNEDKIKADRELFKEIKPLFEKEKRLQRELFGRSAYHLHRPEQNLGQEEKNTGKSTETFLKKLRRIHEKRI